MMTRHAIRGAETTGREGCGFATTPGLCIAVVGFFIISLPARTG